MILLAELRNLGQSKLDGAEMLSVNGRYDSAVYLSGYAVELVLKAQICQTLQWAGFPSSTREFENYRSFKTHDLEVLLNLSGVRSLILPRHFADWAVVSQWNPENRYQIVGTYNLTNAQNMVASTKTLLAVL